MLELEIDFEQNQYETGSQATRQSQQQEADDAMQELENLARRQQQLADNLSPQQAPTEAQQWQQEMLRRDAEELRQRLEQNQQQEQQAQAANNQASAGQAGNQSGEGGTNEQSASELSRRLESALDAMQRASEAMQTGDTDSLQQAAGEAQRQLAGAGETIAEEQSNSLQQSFQDMATEAKSLHQYQAELEDVLLAGVRDAVAAAPEGAATVSSPFTQAQEEAMADIKREMIVRLQRLKEKMLINAEQVRADRPSVSRMIDEADQELKESEIAIRLDLAADYMSQGASLYIANSESIVTRGLDQLSERLEDAARAYTGEQNSESALDRILSDLQQGTEALQQLSSAEAQGSSGSDASNEQQSSQQGQPQQGQSTAQSDSEGQGQTAATNNGQQQGGQQPGGQGTENSTGANGWNGWGARANGEGADNETQLDQFTARLGGIARELRSRGVSEEQINDIQQMVRELQNAGLNGDLNNQMERNQNLALLEQVKQSIENSLSSDDNRVRSGNPTVVPLEYKESVAEYYRRLSNDVDSE
jgi:hypothetical protein